MIAAALLAAGCSGAEKVTGPVPQGEMRVVAEQSKNGGQYKDVIYGFTADLPEAWAGWTAGRQTLSWGGAGESASVRFSLPEKGVIFTVSVHTPEQWNTLQEKSENPPRFIGEKRKHIFGYTITPGAETEVEPVIKTLRLN